MATAENPVLFPRALVLDMLLGGGTNAEQLTEISPTTAGQLVTEGLKIIGLGRADPAQRLRKQMQMLYSIAPLDEDWIARALAARKTFDIATLSDQAEPFDLPCMIVLPPGALKPEQWMRNIYFLGERGMVETLQLDSDFQEPPREPYLIRDISFGGESRAKCYEEIRNSLDPRRRFLTRNELLQLYFHTGLIHWFDGVSPQHGAGDLHFFPSISISQTGDMPILTTRLRKAKPSQSAVFPTCAR